MKNKMFLVCALLGMIMLVMSYDPPKPSGQGVEAPKDSLDEKSSSKVDSVQAQDPAKESTGK